ncbi:MAG: hypothetical protein ACI9W2_005275 [Gammaproteobacteria bacterium]|jgi:hypothetical protein
MDVLSITEARTRPGLRLINRPGVPTPWAQAAKGIIDVKGPECVLAHECADDPEGAQVRWVGDQGAPFVAYQDEPIRGGWAQILKLTERLAPDQSLIPKPVRERAHIAHTTA